jgi:hypothetical protein
MPPVSFSLAAQEGWFASGFTILLDSVNRVSSSGFARRKPHPRGGRAMTLKLCRRFPPGQQPIPYEVRGSLTHSDELQKRNELRFWCSISARS